MSDDSKTVLPEVLPAPTTRDDAMSPRARARRRLESLAKKAALAGAAGTLSACLGYGVVDEVPAPVQCKATDDLNTWLTATAAAQNTTPPTTPAAIELSITIGEGFPQVRGLTFTTLFAADGATVGNPNFTGKDLASSTSVSLTLVPAQTATEIVVHTAIQCADVPRNIDIHIDIASLQVVSIVDAGAK
jgi:hypothetical protein